MAKIGARMNNHSTSALIDGDHVAAAVAQDGLALVALPADVDVLRRRCVEEIALWLERVAGIETTVDEVPDVLVKLAAADRALVGKLYKVSRRFPAARQLASHPWLVKLAERVMETPLVSCCVFVNVRIDLPSEDRYLLPLHQDFPYIQGSLNGLTAWIPFFDTSVEMGPPSWLPGSHLLGVRAVEEFNVEQTGGSGARAVRLVDEGDLSGVGGYVSQPVNAGTALLFSTLLLHQSQPNSSDVARLNIQVRFDDALAEESISRNYPDGLYLGESFRSSYPEYVL